VKRVVLNLLVFAAIASCCWFGWEAYRIVTEAELFQVSGVDVKGLRQLADADIKPIIGAFTGKNIFEADLDGAVQRARMNPWIKDVRIHRSLPNRITMRIVERVPSVILQTDDGRYLMDNETIVIDRVGKEADSSSYPVVIVRGYRARTGEPVTSQGIEEAMSLLNEIAARGGWSLGEITIKAASPEALSVMYADHEFKIGSGRHGEKLRRLAEVMEDAQARGLNIAYVDLRAERQAAVKVADAGGIEKKQNKHR
jgi:cell division protein FtsQ